MSIPLSKDSKTFWCPSKKWIKASADYYSVYIWYAYVNSRM